MDLLIQHTNNDIGAVVQYYLNGNPIINKFAKWFVVHIIGSLVDLNLLNQEAAEKQVYQHFVNAFGESFEEFNRKYGNRVYQLNDIWANNMFHTAHQSFWKFIPGIEKYNDDDQEELAQKIVDGLEKCLNELGTAEGYFAVSSSFQDYLRLYSSR